MGKKNLFLVVFPFTDIGICYVEDNILPLMAYLKQTSRGIFESDTCKIKVCSLINFDNIRGLKPDLIFLSDECDLKTYNEIILPLVNYDHKRIKVVL